MRTLHEADLFTVVNTYSQAEEARWKHQFGDADFSPAALAVSAVVDMNTEPVVVAGLEIAQ